jgi:hypothetical protein
MKRSLNPKMIETPNQAFITKMPKDDIITDEESGEIYHAQKIKRGILISGKHSQLFGGWVGGDSGL